jgi:DNA-directed RNA polymerase specialized sigma24 family protein
MPRQSPFQIDLGNEEKASLEALARRYTSAYRDVIRAKIVLYAVRGLRNDEIAQRLDTPRQVVSKWRKRFFQQGMAGLEELPRQGRPGVSPPRYRRRRKGPRL